MKKKCIMMATVLLVAGVAQATFVTISDVGNVDDTTGYGGVAYEYKISDHEVTIAEFAASGAGSGNEKYWDDPGEGTSVGSGGPAVNVSLYEAMRYCNYLTTGTPNSGYYSTSDGGATYQANALSHYAYAAAHGTTYFVPTEDEWYKAAYYDASGANGYSLYADGTSDINNPPTEGGGETGWNYNSVNLPNYTRGTALGTTEQNGTVNMMGNVWEWMEDSAGVNRGGGYSFGESGLRSSTRGTGNPLNENPATGFRPVVVDSTFVSIGDAGNADDTVGVGYGGVAYEYKISDHEVTISEFSASGAGDGDEDYWNDAGEGTSVGPNAPASKVTLYEAMKYCNWLTTGDTNSGYYITSDGGATYQANALSHYAYAAAHGVTYFVPTEDEWYKAAYYDASGANDYSLYANGTNTIPTEGGDAAGWNYNSVNSSPNYTRDTALGATEQNKTVNMMGNVDEWMEDSAGVLRGGWFLSASEFFLKSSYRSTSNVPLTKSAGIGFRPVVVIPDAVAYVTIGNAGNAADSTNGGIYGNVAYEYKISDREVTIAEFVASGAGNGNENLWNTGGYSVGSGAPASQVSLYEAMKYCNWLTTGDTNSGYYSTSDGGSTYQANALAHDAYAAAHGTTYFVPTEDEWYKAAYYDASGANGYSLYADGISDINNPPTEGGGETGWNYNWANSAPNRTRGTALGATEQNGTVNMMGNLYEWIEDSTGALRGGMYGSDEADLRSSYRLNYIPSNENYGVGFRPVVVERTFVTIGNAGNTNDASGYGSVAYEYKISDHEVSIAEFAASGAGSGNEGYWNETANGRTVGANAPASNVSLYEAMKYCNWLTTGDTNSGYYSTSDGVVYVANALGHDAYATAHGTTYFVPTENEWYKAAYWTGNGYSRYANGTNTTPQEGGSTTGWNYSLVKSYPNYTRGTALGTTEQNGTVNMMGNVEEWMEDSVGVTRGGYYSDYDSWMSSSSRYEYYSPSYENSATGFRPVVVISTFAGIGDAGNVDDTAGAGYGGVAYEYKISDHEVTIAEFTASGAGSGNESYWNDDSTTGSGRTAGPNAPATHISLYEAMKYCNYLTTGYTNSGYYSTSDGGSTYQVNTLSHYAYAATHGITYFVPTEDEWYKAAYWTGNGYSDYANGDDVADGAPNDVTTANQTGWNYDGVNTGNLGVWVTGGSAREQNSTYDMMGNVSEWMEDSAGDFRGGIYYDEENYLRSSARVDYNPSNESGVVGFRPVVVISTFVNIGDAGNEGDMFGDGGCGGVAYEYKISAQEVSIAKFAASGAGDGDENLWNDDSTTGSGRTLGPNAPAVNVSRYEAMRYCNWLTTGDTNIGYYSTSDGGTTYQANALSHDVYVAAYGTTYFIPTQDEWYKAAYWTGSGYSLYADGTSDTNNPPTEGGSASGWNYNDVNPSPNYTRGTVLGTTEQNGTVNMMGNVAEWMEDSAGVIRGGSYVSIETSLRSSVRFHGYNPTFEHIHFGFRTVVVVPVSATATAPSIVMSGLDISWQGEIGQNYSVMTTTNLVTVQWAPVPGWPQSGTGNMLIYSNTYTDKQRYFKVTVGSQ